MRWSQLYAVLMAGVLAFTALTTWGAEAPVGWTIGALAGAGLAGAAAALMARQTPRVAIVSEPRGMRLYRLHEALDEAGFGLVFCPGPEARPCPVLEGKPCPVSGHPVAAVVVRGADPEAFPPCGRGLGVPVVTARDEGGDAAGVARAVRRVSSAAAA